MALLPLASMQTHYLSTRYPRSMLTMQNLGPTPDLLSHNLRMYKIPGDGLILEAPADGIAIQLGSMPVLRGSGGCVC